MKKGFTLIELLAVIVILAVISLISTPIVLNIMEDVEKGAWKASAYGIMKAAENEYATSFLKKEITEEEAEGINFQYSNYIESNINGRNLDYKGNKPKKGNVFIDNEGKIALAIYNGKYCAKKTVSEKK